MKKLFLILVGVAFLSISHAQTPTLYVPGGTATGIGNNTTNSNVGIGVSNPSQTLHLKNNSGSIVRLQSSTAIWDLQSDAFLNGNYTSGPADVTRSLVMLGSNGNVGIGTSTPSQKLEVTGTISSLANYGLIVSPPSGDAIIKRGNSGGLMISSGGGTSDVKINYNYGGGSGGLTVFDGSTVNNTNFGVNASGNLSITPSGGNVGIGTMAPADQLEIVSGNRKVGFNTVISGVSNGGVIALSRPDDGSKTMYIGPSASPTDDNVIFSQGGATELRFVSNGGPFSAAGFGFYNNVSAQLAFGSAKPSNTPVMKIDGNGNVGIGIPNPDAKLAVSGQVHAQEVKVSVTVPGPDYVFEKDYQLTSLEDIKTYIDENKHLPEVPSAKDMERNGVQLGEMNMLLLKKIEELTLLMIELKEENKRMNSDNLSLKTEIEDLKNLIIKR